MRQRRAIVLASAFASVLAGCGSTGAPATAPASPARSASSTAAPQTISSAKAILTPPKTTTSSGYRTINTLPSFWTFWKEAEGQSVAAQQALFKRIVVGKHPELFEPGVVGRSPAERNGFDMDAKLEPWLKMLPGRIEGMRHLSHSIASDLDAFDASFKATFPDMAWDGTVYFTVSLDAFDGAVREVNKQPALLFGIDKVVLIHGAGANIEPLFHHELFHVYHQAFLRPDKNDRGMWGPLWSEGLAVYVAKRLNPTATASQLVLNDEMITEGKAKLGTIAKELRGQLKATTEEMYRDFFLGAGKRTDIPNRVGYYIGMRIAEELGKTRTLKQLSRLRGPALRELVDQTLAGFRDGQ